MSSDITTRASGRSSERISLAILAMGGQGGGVLADWIVALAESQGWAAQSTSVPGVAQRTGATIYYIEMAPPKDGAAPVFALMPTPGDVDVVMAAELMEAGRSVLRGLVTPDRTTLIASTHRALAVAEKQTPGDGVGDPAAVSRRDGFRRQAGHRLRHGGAGQGQGQRDFRDACSARSPRRSAAVRARGLRGGDPRRRHGRRVRACAPSPPLSISRTPIRSSRSGAFPEKRFIIWPE